MAEVNNLKMQLIKIAFIIAPKSMKYLWVNLTKVAQDLYAEGCETTEEQ